MSAPFSFVRHRHSGYFGTAPILLPVVALPVAVGLSIAYAYLMVYSPFFLLNLIAVIFYVGACGLAVAYLGRFAKCRSPQLLGWFGLACGLISLYVSWVFFVYAFLQKEFPPAVPLSDVAQPDVLWRFVLVLNRNGYFDIFGWTPSGVVLWIGWAIEALIIVLGVTFISVSLIIRELFCETCSVWCEPAETRYLEPTEEVLKADTDSITIEQLIALEPLVEKRLPCIRCEAMQCPHCQETQGLRFTRLRQEVEDGKTKEASDEIPYVYVPAGQGEAG